MSYFDTDFLNFFQELNQNNTKTWFDKNRKRYEKNIKEPFYEFIQELILRLQDEDKDLYTEPKESIFRINNDLRFTRDKTPYKTHVSAALNTGGRKKVDSPGYFIQLSFDKIWLGGGLYHPSKEGLYKIREFIQTNPEDLTKLVHEKSFTEIYGSLQGEKNKKLPLEFKETMEKYPGSLIEHKQFYFIHEQRDTTTMLESGFIKTIVANYRAGLPINTFLRKALRD